MSESSRPRYSSDGRRFWRGGRWTAVGQAATRPHPPIWLPACAAAVMVLIVGATLTLTVRANGRSHLNLPSANASGLYGLRACNGGGYDEASHLCNSRLSESASSARVLGCSIFVNGHQGQLIHSFLKYRADVVYRGYTRLSYQNSNVGFSYALAPVDPLPGGNWSCGFNVSTDAVSTEFHLSGPSRQLLYSAACEGSIMQSSGAGRMCPSTRDEFAQAASVGCSAALVGDRHAHVDIVVVYRGGAVQPITKTYAVVASSDLFVASVQLEAVDYGVTGSLPAGWYMCEWTANGHALGSTTFHVT